MPAVMNLNDILALYGEGKKATAYEQLTGKPKVFEFETKTRKESKMDKTEEQIRAEVLAEIQAKADADKAKALEDQVKEFTAKQDAVEKELKELRQLKADADKKALEAAIAAKEAQTKEFVTGLKTEKLCTPAMEPLLTALLGEDKKEYSIKVGEEDKKLNKQELLKEALNLLASAKEVNFAENSSKGKSGAGVDEGEQEKQVQAYMKENNCSYGKAAKAIMAKNKNK
jgi:hypothetical protein